MVKRLLTLCAVALVGVAVMASPEEMQKRKDGRKAAPSTTIGTSANVLPVLTQQVAQKQQQKPQRNAVKFNAQRKPLQMAAKSAAKAPAWVKASAPAPDDTIDIALGDLPFSYSGKTGDAAFGRIFRIIADADTSIMLSMVMDKEPGMYAGVFDALLFNPLVLNDYGLGRIDVAEHDTLLFRLDYNPSYPNEEYSVVISAISPSSFIDLTDPSTYTIDSVGVPFKVEGVEMPANTYYIRASSRVLPLAHIYRFAADKDTTYVIKGTDLVDISDIYNPNSMGDAVMLTLHAGDVLTVAVASENSTYDFEVYKGFASFAELNHVPYSKVDLPYSESGVFDAVVGYFGAPAKLYQFTLTKANRVKLYVECTDLWAVDIVNGNCSSVCYLNNYVSETALAAGTYYALIIGGQDSDYEVYLDTVADDYKSEYAYYELDYSQKITLGETIYNKASFAYSPLVNTPDWGGIGQSCSIDLQPGMYSIKATTQIDNRSAYADCGLFAFRNQFDSVYSDDLLGFGSGSTYVGKAEAELVLTVTEAGTYHLLMLSWPDANTIDFFMVVEPYVPEYYTARTIPYTVKGDFATGAVPFGSSHYNGLSFVYVPNDTIIEVTAKASAYNASFIYVNVGQESGNIGTYSEGDLYLGGADKEYTIYINVDAGFHYIGYEASGYFGQTFNYEYSVKYLDKPLVSDTITIAQLLAAAPQATLDQPQSVTFGLAPSRLVAGNGVDFGDFGDYYYAVAYKLQADSGQVLVLQRAMADIGVSLYIYQQTADTIVYVGSYDYSNASYELDSTTTYYAVFRTYSGNVGNADCIVSFADKSKFCTIDTLLANATAASVLEPTTFELGNKTAALVEGEDGRFQYSGYQYYAVAYKMVVDSGNVIRATYNASNVDNYWYVYAQIGDTIVKMYDENDCYDVTFEADTTTTYYLVYTTYSSLELGEITISFDVVAPVSVAAILATAKPLTAERGELEFGTSVYVPQINQYAWAFKANMDSAQVFNTTYNGWLHVYRVENGEYVNYLNANSHSQMYADSTATYYFLGTYNIPVMTYSMSYEISRHISVMYDDAQLVQLPLVLTDSLVAFEKPLYNSDTETLAYVNQVYSFDANKDDMIGMITFDNVDNGQMIMVMNSETNTEQLMADVTSANSFSTAIVDDTARYNLVELIDWSSYQHTDIRGVVNHIHKSMDVLLNSHVADDYTAIPYSANAKMLDMLLNDWLYDGGVFTEKVIKVQGKAGDKYTLTTNNAFDCYMYVYYFKDDAFTFDWESYINSGKRTIEISIAEDADYYIILGNATSLTETDYWFDYLGNQLQFSLVNSTEVIEIKDIVTDCDYIEVDELKEMFVKEAVADLNVYAVTTDNKQILIDNVVKRWSFDADLTEATYAPKLDKTLYKWAANADTTVALFINPAKISASAGDHGEISPSGTKRVRRNSQVTYTITADQGYVISKILVNGDPVSADCLNKREGEYRFKATKNTTIEVEFKSTSAVSETEMINTVVYGRDRMIIVDGAEENSDIRIFTLTGSVIYAGRITSTYEQYNVPASGLYIVRIADKATKVIVK